MNLKELLSNIEFDYKIIKDDEGKNAIQLIDENGVNLGHIEDDIFHNTADIIDRTEQYWKDYVIDDTAERLGFGENSTWKDVYNAAVLKDDIDTDVLRCLVYPETVEIEEFKFAENTMNHDETLIFEDLQALSNEEYSALPKFNRVKIYNPSIYGLLPDDDKIHVLAEYNGNENEDAVFNQLNDKDFPSKFNGIEIDWNPISVEQSGTIEQYLNYLVKVQEKFEKEKESYNVSDIIKETVERTVNEKIEQDNEKFYSLLKQHFPEITKEVSDIISSSMSEIESEVVINKSGVFVKDITDGKQEINRVDFTTLVDYALGNPLLTKEQTKILENIGQNSNNKEVNMRNSQLDSIDTERMNELAEKAYHKYQYEWLFDKGISLDDLADEMDVTLENYMEETNGERIDAWQQLREVIDNGINGEMFSSLDEFKTNEFLDPKSIELGHLLEGHEMDEYLSHIQSYAKSLGVEIDDPMKELEPVTVTKENALDFFTKLSEEKKASISDSLKSINVRPLDVYSHGDESYLVSKTQNGTFTSHLITESGLEWGHYDIPTKWQAQKQTMQRAAGTSFDNIDLVEVEPVRKHLAEVIWDREDIKFAIVNNHGSNIDENQVTDKQIDDVISNLNTERLEEAMIETGWTYIDQAVSETIEMKKKQEHRLDNVYVADKDRKVALKFKPDIQFNEKTGEFDMPHISVTFENTITGVRFTDSNFKEKVTKEAFLQTPYIDKFVERTAEKYGITKNKIEYISKEEFEAIAQDRKSIKPLKEQYPLERWSRMTQDVMFKKGIEDNSENTDKILSIAKGILKSFSNTEKEQCKFNISLDSKFKNEQEVLAHALGSGYTHDLNENKNRNQIRTKNHDDKGISR